MTTHFDLSKIRWSDVLSEAIHPSFHDKLDEAKFREVVEDTLKSSLSPEAGRYFQLRFGGEEKFSWNAIQKVIGKKTDQPRHITRRLLDKVLARHEEYLSNPPEDKNELLTAPRRRSLVVVLPGGKKNGVARREPNALEIPAIKALFALGLSTPAVKMKIRASTGIELSEPMLRDIRKVAVEDVHDQAVLEKMAKVAEGRAENKAWLVADAAADLLLEEGKLDGASAYQLAGIRNYSVELARLLSGKSTANLSVMTTIVQKSTKKAHGMILRGEV